MNKLNPKIETPETGVVTAITPMDMLQIAVDKGADLDQLTKLMDLQERWEKNEARKAFVVAINSFKADPPRIFKNRHVSFSAKGGRTEYDHATLDQVCDLVGKALSDHGLSHRWEVEQPDAGINVTCVLTHTLGHEERVTMRALPDDSGSKNLIQQIGSATTYLQRYTLLAATGLAATDQDDDGATATEFIDADEKAELVALIKKTQADNPKFLKYLGVQSLDEMPAYKFGEAKAALEKKGGK
jgi:hypothetical protein